jgi:hypothetical protein
MYTRDDSGRETRSEGIAEPEVQHMFQLGFAETIQADREREIAELVRQRRLLEPDIDGPQSDDPKDHRGEPHPQRARTHAASS